MQFSRRKKADGLDSFPIAFASSRIAAPIREMTMGKPYKNANDIINLVWPNGLN